MRRIVPVIILVLCGLSLSCENPWVAEIWQLKTVSFDTNGGTPSIPAQKILKTYKVIKPADPIKPNFKFTGWFTDNGTFENEWDFDEIPEKDMTLYAGWIDFGLTISPINQGDELDFGEEDYGYSSISLETVNVKNTTDIDIFDVTVTLSGTGVLSFDISPISFKLNTEQSEDISISPKDGLSSGIHTATVTISGGGYTTNFSLKFTVNPVATPVDITIEIDQIKNDAVILGSSLPAGWTYNSDGGYYNSDIVLSISNTSPNSNEKAVNVTLPSGVTVKCWEVQGKGAYIDEVVFQNGGNSFTVMASLTNANHVKYCTIGYHFLRLYITADGKEYMINIQFEIIA